MRVLRYSLGWGTYGEQVPLDRGITDRAALRPFDQGALDRAQERVRKAVVVEEMREAFERRLRAHRELKAMVWRGGVRALPYRRGSRRALALRVLHPIPRLPWWRRFFWRGAR